MASQDGQDRNLPASERKLKKARDEGQVARSRDLGHFAAIGVGGVTVAAFAGELTARMTRLLDDGLRFDRHAVATPDAMLEKLAELVQQMLWLVLPLGLLMMVVAVAVAVAGGGWVWTSHPLMPQFDRLNPISGLPRILSKQQLTDTLKASALALIIGTIGALFMRANVDVFGGTLALALPAALSHVGQTLQTGLMLILLALAAFAAVDLPLQRHLHKGRLKMSHQEQKQEHKEQEGNAEVKGRMRARMRELARRRMLAEVPKADLVVMNPTHYAVALRYDETSMGAPRVVAKGADLLAMKIRDIAKEAKVPVLLAAPLARALYAHAEIDREIPAALFSAVAQVLAYVYQLKASMTQRNVKPPADLPDLPVPPELDPHNTGKAMPEDTE